MMYPASLAVTHDDCATLKVQILRAQAHALKNAHAGAVEQFRECRVFAAHECEGAQHFAHGEHFRQALLCFRATDFHHPRQLNLQHFSVQKQ